MVVLDARSRPVQLMLAAGSRNLLSPRPVGDVPERMSGRAPLPGSPHRPSCRRASGPCTQIRQGDAAHRAGKPPRLHLEVVAMS